MTNLSKAYVDSPLGLLEILGTDEAIKSIRFIEPDQPDDGVKSATVSPVLEACVEQFEAYFKGELREFSLPLDPDGTDFQKAVWRELVNIPFGTTVSYLDIAKALNNEKAVRAVGMANGRNKLNIVIPCHRVIGSDGSLTGYGGGLWRKEWLLTHEGVLDKKQLPLF